MKQIFLSWLAATLMVTAVVFTLRAVLISLLSKEIKTGTYGVRQCRADIDEFFSEAKSTPASEKALDRALAYMTKGSEVGHHNISDMPSWDYYMSQKRINCGG